MTGAFPLLGMTASADGFLGSAQKSSDVGSVLESIPGVGPGIAMGSAATRSIFGKSPLDSISASGWFGVRGLTLILGLLLIAGAIFSHPTVVNVGKSVAKKAGEAAAVAA